MQKRAYLVLENGFVFPGSCFGAELPSVSDLTDGMELPYGELVFNTGMSGYHEILTDPSYTGQIVTMTYPHIGNYGCDDLWSENGPEDESRKDVKVSALVVRDLYDGPVPEGRIKLPEYLDRNGICGISGVDTRRLTLMLRDEGSCNAVLVKSSRSESGLSDDDLKLCQDYLKKLPSMEGQNLIADVGTSRMVTIDGAGSHIALLDCGIKANIIRELEQRGCRISLIPSDASIEDIRKLNPQGVFLSNGPGDPGVLKKQVDLARNLLGEYPLVGICLGHQILGQSIGAETFKMKFGHHGCNHPVRDEESGRVFVTSQNHGFAVNEESLPEGVTVRFRNANDGSIEGLEWKDKNLLCVQFHPEAAPGPVDSSWIFDAFLDVVKKNDMTEVKEK
ncbi:MULTISPECIES: glutamine-hydrolyzing carbamoyl-phosphate synthase small subunit [unclassified Oceanispirochaeta]|uniref:glutamine-hydrolyzing carbamoyl-phosphate synthase small subunit n=1 Tax=unclassified Oceanispirochaeta TaxID=2635722 RepID=UPI000E095A80|nr:MULTISPECIES: glutamine-hydrolyzing carbamoyl-phosphate synthase small subunit [unclassified Oceanispirochaeta]MBF9018083.1 glutamine-hydrolyzing carbamoyl-phosphate synthase small subunit [Oceanispirochaeta sp. M2]NPD74547.1 glutamine-hydrolyzing carbamoyl-phosphate synthase small subunit [Oceanispirochaeta sp. M1]RDG29578.1 carbamoyl-phosphate synthase small subunit [Oceanispirochaeta sp. M1]